MKMNDKYTAEQVERLAYVIDGNPEMMDGGEYYDEVSYASAVLRDYAAYLRELEADKAVADELCYRNPAPDASQAPNPSKSTVLVAPMLASARVPEGWRLGDVDVAQDGDMWTAGIDIPVDRRHGSNGIHASAIECHAATKELAEALRTQVMLAATLKTEKE